MLIFILTSIRKLIVVLLGIYALSAVTSIGNLSPYESGDFMLGAVIIAGTLMIAYKVIHALEKRLRRRNLLNIQARKRKQGTNHELNQKRLSLTYLMFFASLSEEKKKAFVSSLSENLRTQFFDTMYQAQEQFGLTSYAPQDLNVDILGQANVHASADLTTMMQQDMFTQMQQHLQQDMFNDQMRHAMEESLKAVTPFDHGGYVQGDGFNPSDTMAADSFRSMDNHMDHSFHDHGSNFGNPF